MPDLDAIVNAIKAFDWSDYGLDNLGEVESDDWAYALAQKIWEATNG